MAKYPCRGCVYFKACGELTRTTPCAGRKTKREQKHEHNAQRTLQTVATEIIIHTEQHRREP